MTKPTGFPKDFVWGVASSALQVEGADRADGKSASIWDAVNLKPGQVEDGSSPAVSCDFYRRYKQDIRLMRELGFKHFRFSINWCRIMPRGGTTVNQRGLDFYKRLCDELHKAGITPWATLYHWDLPQELEDAGGWPVRSTVDAFEPYVTAAVKSLRGHIKNWMTINELHTFIQCGYRIGIHAPFRKEPDAVVWQAHHHVLLAHGLAVRAVREHGSKGSRVGFVHNPETPIPVDESPANVAAALAYYEHITGHYFGPMCRGAYAPAFLKQVGKDRPKIAPGDMELISTPTDFIGLNQYGGNIVRASKRRPGWEHLPYPTDFPRGGFSWLGDMPSCLYWGPRLTHELYKPAAIYITENGLHSGDEVNATGEVQDLYRCQWLHEYLTCLQRGVTEGIPTKGYFHWSLMDSFEWQHGYNKRLGLVHVDFQTLKRTPKMSAYVYAHIAAANRITHLP
ncbi:MAG: family 1 glycosylhydrolase [Verrucomicrobiota bacterium]